MDTGSAGMDTPAPGMDTARGTSHPAPSGIHPIAPGIGVPGRKTAVRGGNGAPGRRDGDTGIGTGAEMKDDWDIGAGGDFAVH